MKTCFSEKKVSKIFFALMLLFLLQGMAFCQDSKKPGQPQGKPPASNEERMKAIQEKVFKPLALSSTQNETVTKAYKDFFTGMESLRKLQTNTQVPLEKSKVEPLEKARDEKIRQVLSKEQFAKYQELEKASRPPKPAGTEPRKN
jgi:hypothetical protein